MYGDYMTWQTLIEQEKNKEYFKKLELFIDEEYTSKNCFPPKENIYKAFDLTPLDKVKVVIIGQDPYPTKDVAIGLAFSVNKNMKIPKSLHNMFIELQDDLKVDYPKNGDLSKWAINGVLLLNRILTVVEGTPLAHKDKGWEKFTSKVIDTLNLENRKIVFILLGNEAKKIKKQLNNPLHKIIEAPHPSPLSVYHGFFGSKIYSKTCEYLNEPYSIWSLE